MYMTNISKATEAAAAKRLPLKALAHSAVDAQNKTDTAQAPHPANGGSPPMGTPPAEAVVTTASHFQVALPQSHLLPLLLIRRKKLVKTEIGENRTLLEKATENVLLQLYEIG